MATTYTLDDNGSTPWQSHPAAPGYYLSEVMALAAGTFSSGTLTLEYSVDGGATVAVASPSVTLTADGVVTFKIHPELSYRMTLSGAGSPDLTVHFLP